MPRKPAARRPAAFVLDTSALLSMLWDQPGGSLVGAELRRSVISAVNWSEVVEAALVRGDDIEGITESLTTIGFEILPFTPEDAEATAAMATAKTTAGLPFSVRACLALASRLGLPAFTADRTLSHRDLEVDVRLLR